MCKHIHVHYAQKKLRIYSGGKWWCHCNRKKYYKKTAPYTYEYQCSWNDFLKNTLNINNPENATLLSLYYTGIGNNLFDYFSAIIYGKKTKREIYLISYNPFEKFMDITKNLRIIDKNFKILNGIISKKLDETKTINFINHHSRFISSFYGFEDFIRKNMNYTFQITPKNKK